MSQGNAVTLLFDSDVFQELASRFAHAEHSILISQLFFSLPPFFADDAHHEQVQLVFDFDHDEEKKLDAEHLRAISDQDTRPERSLLDKVDNGADLRFLLQAFKVPFFVKLLVGALVFPFAGTDGVAAAIDAIMDKADFDNREVRKYFESSGRPHVTVQAFEQSALNAGVLHAKLVLVDGAHAVSVGSPFVQRYVDSHDHRIDAPMRGDCTNLPVHDASFAVDGPAVGDLHDTYRFLWNTAAPSDTLPPLQDVPQPQNAGGDAICSMQIVRTLSSGRFDNPEDGEKGILEAYLRAIAEAKHLIYLENQYFTNDAIGHALVEAMKRTPELCVIMVVPIKPDIPTYPRKQRQLITRIRKAIGQTPEGPQRYGVFTRWSHELTHLATPPGTSRPTVDRRPRILPIYIHAKAGLVDDTWATIGSANLDGLSLDSSYVSDILRKLFHTREQRAIEVNGLFFNNVAGQPASGIVDLMRRRLWAEHLGYRVAPDVPDINAPAILTPPPGGWLKLWSDRAEALRQQLINHPDEPQDGMAKVLAWPTDDTTRDYPRKHLEALGVPSFKVVPLKSTRAFQFADDPRFGPHPGQKYKGGLWRDDSTAEMDYP